ncbi:MAG: hypothetical protein A2V66_17335 [Ignavibacteria bacterium RBG_13_36_8]|nr:MAG: hypothetical protein A2V66_17335 [Ignavibacteria bacterium RBG_13_36_8]
MKIFQLIILLVALSGCDLFTTRDPEDPTSTRSNFVPATTPEILFQNLQESFRERITENYMACFVDSSYLAKQYVFNPAVSSLSQFPNLSDWTLEAERQHFNYVKSISSPNIQISLLLENRSFSSVDDGWIYQYEYTLSIPTTNPAIPGIYKGIAQFKIENDSRPIWVITEWTDIQVENFPCWSELKGRSY